MESFVALGGVVLAEGPHHELPVPPQVVGIGAFVSLAVLLLITLAFGKGRPHS
jgi:hypothetical protein